MPDHWKQRIGNEATIMRTEITTVLKKRGQYGIRGIGFGEDKLQSFGRVTDEGRFLHEGEKVSSGMWKKPLLKNKLTMQPRIEANMIRDNSRRFAVQSKTATAN